MIDDRFLKKPTIPVLPLYFNDSINYNKENIRSLFFSGIPHQNLILDQSATICLLKILSTFNKKLTIGIPSFFCQHFAISLIRNNYEIVFYEYDWQKNISKASVDFLIENGVDVFIIPQIFSNRPFPFDIINQLLNMNKIVVLDQAQTFPYEEIISLKHDNLYSLFSFGKNKPLGLIHGGAMFSSNQSINHLENIQIEYVISKFTSKKFKKMRDLITFQIDNNIKKNSLSIPSTLDINDIDINFFFSKISIMKNRWEIIKNTISKTYLTLFEKDMLPTILSLTVENRYYYSKLFSKKNIETTWYYYPLPLLDFFSKYPHQLSNQTINISNTIMIFPFNIYQTDEQFDYLVKTMKEIL